MRPKIILLLIIIGLFIIISTSNSYQREAFEASNRTISNTKSDYDILNDSLFKNVTYFNDDNKGRLGLDMCIEQCNGTCLEYGMTGDAYCFPPWNATIGAEVKATAESLFTTSETILNTKH